MDNPSSSPSTFRFVKRPESDSPSDPTRNHDPLELRESDVVWSFSSTSTNHRLRRFVPLRSGLSAALSDDRRLHVLTAAVPRAIPSPPEKLRQSAPVNIPAWPRRFGDEESNRFDEIGEDGYGDGGDDEVEEEEEREEMVPPHVMVARSHVTFSVFEGVGRTLKGRDLKRVRNTVFQKTGFID